jgi:predicted MPP superfamily phosphohydrolase
LESDELHRLEERLGRLHARQRLGVERDHEAQVFGQGLTFFHVENSKLSALAIELILKATGLFWRGRKNAERVEVRRNRVSARGLPRAFDGFAILHISDLHCDMSEGAVRRVTELVPTLSYDLCVLTGDFRGPTCGPFDKTLASMAELCSKITAPMLAVLGNHDSARMVPGLEAMDIKVLSNECETITRGTEAIYVAGVDDPHFYRADNIEKASTAIPLESYSILLTHTPEIYRQAAHAGFDLLLSGHTHGGQICLPGGVAMTYDSVLPRRLGKGAWKHHDMHGYTSVGAGSSVVPVRFNCPPEITLHTLQKI